MNNLGILQRTQASTEKAFAEAVRDVLVLHILKFILLWWLIALDLQISLRAIAGNVRALSPVIL